MPAHSGVVWNITSSGSFIMRESSHNWDRFPCARNDPSWLYPSYEEVYICSDNHDLSLDEFQDLGLNNFLVAQRWVARQKLERLQLTPHQGSLLSQGIQPHWEHHEPYNTVFEVSMGYAALCSIVVMDEVVSMNERSEEKMEGIQEEVRMLKEELQEEKAACFHLACQFGKLNLQVWEIQRQLWLVQAAPPLRRMSDDETDEVWERHALRLAENQAVWRAQTLAEFEGWLIPIGEPDCAEGLPRSVEVIDLTGEPKVIDLTGDSAVIDLTGEEEEQALEEIEGGVVMFDVEVCAARVDPALEYEALPDYIPSYPNSLTLD